MAMFEFPNGEGEGVSAGEADGEGDGGWDGEWDGAVDGALLAAGAPVQAASSRVSKMNTYVGALFIAA